MVRIPVILADFIISFMWVWSGALNRIFVYKTLGLGSQPNGEMIKGSLSILIMFFFAWLGKVSGGGAYNPLTVLSGAVSGSLGGFLLAVGGRIPAQVIGSIIGVKLIKETFPEVGHGPRLNIDIHWGALTEGLLTFAIVILSRGLAKSNPSSFFIKTWITSVSKLSLHILGSDLTGGCMNPASAMGWAFARGDHITKEHLFVYWLAPVEATLLAVWTFKLLVQPHKKQKQLEEEKVAKTKSD
ncbi:probable aquaporin SIP2-1 [Magnolia sinica]|uniref:probable aquaporin SIP2-1 n=1 Tax=Magnolia sinica TaxID=86752 RepID=UPI00265B2576|nr:probable aquaporin SIP2-1 [Magnolia sinica]